MLTMILPRLPKWVFAKHAALLLTAIILPACVQRTISITSDPPGALVHLNDEEVGRTPVTVPFTFYGLYDVRVEKDGYQPLWTTHRTNMPWWELPGPDLAAEMVPNGKSELHWHFNLDPVPEGEDVNDALIERAKEFGQTLTTEP